MFISYAGVLPPPGFLCVNFVQFCNFALLLLQFSKFLCKILDASKLTKVQTRIMQEMAKDNGS